MDRFLSSDLGRNVRSDTPQEEGRQEWLGNIPVVRAHRVSAARPVLLVGQFRVGIGRRHMRLIRAALLSTCDRRIAGVLVLRVIQ